MDSEPEVLDSWAHYRDRTFLYPIVEGKIKII